MKTFFNKIFKKQYRDFGLTKIWTLLKIKNIELQLIHYTTFEEDEFPFQCILKGMQWILKGGFIVEKYKIFDHNFFSESNCHFPYISSEPLIEEYDFSICSINEYNFRMLEIVFLFPEEIIKKKKIKPNTWLLQITFNDYSDHISKRFFSIKK